MHELGYVVVKESHRNRGISKAISKKLLSFFQGRPLFATTANEYMERTLSETLFLRNGISWKGKKNQDLHLWIKD